MAIPDYQTIMRPLLEHLDQTGEARSWDADEHLARHFQLTEDELQEMLPSGRAPAFKNRAYWARFHLKAAGLIEESEHGLHRITARGRKAIRDPSAVIDRAYLRQFNKHAPVAWDGSTPDGYWVGRLDGTGLIVFDHNCQPRDPNWVYIYFVHGNAMKTRVADKERRSVATVRDPRSIDFAISHYKKWKKSSEEELERRRALATYEEEAPPLPRQKCPSCKGEGSWRWTVGTFSEGGHSDGQNFHEICSDCHGEGYVYILS